MRAEAHEKVTPWLSGGQYLPQILPAEVGAESPISHALVDVLTEGAWSPQVLMLEVGVHAGSTGPSWS